MKSGRYSEETARLIDREVKKLVEECFDLAREILTREMDFLNYLADMLLINETLDHEEMEIIYNCTAKKRLEQGQDAEPAADSAACELETWDKKPFRI